MTVKKPGASSKKASPRKSAAKKAAEQTIITMPGHIASETEAEVRRRAYDLYQAHGHQHGRDREDWLEAEAEVLSRLEKKETA
jgi:hypothetical protein